MTRKQRFFRNVPRGAGDWATDRHSLTACRLGYETLEDRRLLAGYFDNIANEVAGSGGAINDITTALHGLTSGATLPLINKPLQEIGPISAALDGLEAARNTLHSNPSSLSPTSTLVEIQTAIFNALSPEHCCWTRTTRATCRATTSSSHPMVRQGSTFRSMWEQAPALAPDAGLGIPSIPFARRQFDCRLPN